MFTLVHDCNIVPGYRTDHSGTTLKIKLQENESGRGYWKFNNSLLKDTNYVTTVKGVIKDTINTYKINNIDYNYDDAEGYNDNNNINNNNNDNNDNGNNNNDKRVLNDIEFTINDQLFVETLLIMIRGKPLNIVLKRKRKVCKRKLI